MQRPVIIFDFGNVVGFFDYTRIYERFTPILAINLEELRLRLQRGGFAELLVQFESGRIAPTVFADNMMAQLGLEIPYEDFVRMGRHFLAQRTLGPRYRIPRVA